MSYVGSLPLNISLHQGNPQLVLKPALWPQDRAKGGRGASHLIREFEGKDGGGDHRRQPRQAHRELFLPLY